MQMELRLTSENSRHSRSWSARFFGAMFLLGLAWPAWAASPSDRDYLTAEGISGGHVVSASAKESSGSQAKVASTSRYRAFDGQYYDLYENPGRYVNVLLPAATGHQVFFTPDHVEEMVDLLDVLYTDYRDLLQFEPKGDGLLTIAFIPQTCGMGCGLLGHKGIEIQSETWMFESITRELNSGRLDTILVHEMVHNFDAFARYLHYLPDHAHAWTDLFEYFAPYRYARNSRKNDTPDEIYHSPLQAVWRDYIADDSADWERCVKNSACEDKGLSSNNLWAMVYYRIDDLHGVEALLDSFRFIREYAKTHSPPQTEIEKEGLRTLSLAEGVGANISCYLDALKWPVSGDVRSELNQRFGAGSTLCEDLDKDGFGRIDGDCDDNDADRNMLSPEIAANGKDDDCDDLVDEELLVESDWGPDEDNFKEQVAVTLPFEVAGNAASSSDIDEFRFPLTATGRIRVKLCAADPFEGWAVALKPDGRFVESSNWFTYQSLPGCTSESLDFESYSQGGLSIIPDNSNGNYSVTVSEAVKLPPDFSASLQVLRRPGGGVSLRVEDGDGWLGQLGADEMEFWISDAGIRFIRPFSTPMAIALPPAQYPQLNDGRHYQVRMRPRANGLPLAAFSAGHLFQFERSGLSQTIDDGFSGAWFDPKHDGEGFVIEVLEDQRALVYWFTYHNDGRQRWMMGVGDVTDNRIVINELLDSRGGRFGNDFNPAEVTLLRVGSLTITFNSCSQAVANYTVDQLGGHQLLGRLTDIYGHECGIPGTAPVADISGSWYDPAHDGEGFVVQQVSVSTAVVFWFTYDDAGNQAWLLDTGTLAGNHISFPQVVQPAGGVFGRSYNPASVIQKDWGGLTLELGCAGGVASYQARAEGYADGAQSLVALTRLKNSGCAD